MSKKTKTKKNKATELDRFLHMVYEVRGKIKSQKHIDMLNFIYRKGNATSKKQVSKEKYYGIAFIAEVAMMSKSKQDKFWKELQTLSTRRSDNAKLLLLKYK